MDFTVFLPTRIFTGNSKQPWAEALGIDGDRIAIVGTNAQVKKDCRRKTQIFCAERTVSDPRLCRWAYPFRQLWLSPPEGRSHGRPSLSACRERIRQAAAGYRRGNGLSAGGGTSILEPTRFDLDDLAPNNPTMMIRACGHSVLGRYGSADRGGNFRRTPDPPGSRIERDPVSGEPNGLLREIRRHMEKFISSPSI